MSNTQKVSDVPFLMKQWSTANEADPSAVSTGSHHKYQWECKECGYTWEAEVKSRYKAGGKCPCHESNKVIMPGVNDILTLLPVLKDYCDTEKNEAEGIDISREGFDSSMVANWKCPECGREWKSNIRSRSKKENGVRVAVLCPHYNTVKRKKEEVPTIDQVPDLFKFWNQNKNPDASTVKANSMEYANWRCSNCGYEWHTTIVSQTKGTGKCACCELLKVPSAGYSDLFTLIPEAKDSYDFEKNIGIDIYNMGVGDKTSVWWTCPDCNRSWQASITSRVRRTDNGYSFSKCRQCYLTDTDRITPVSTNKLLVKHWDFKMNKDYDINLTSVHCTDTVHWHCKDCGHTWEASIRGMHCSFQGCQRCNNPEYFISSYPGLIEALDKIFDATENPGIDIKKLRVNSKKEVHFHCKSCNHEWNGIIGNRIRKNEDDTYRVLGCPVCDNNRKRALSYSEQYPALADMYNEEASGYQLDSLTAEESNHIKLIWSCSNCHRSFPSTLRAMIASMKTSTKGCPFCAHTAIVEGESFGDVHPELLDEYADENDIDPFEVYPNSKKEVLWRCTNNPEHTWTARFFQRHIGEAPCPICNRTRLIKGTNTFADVYPDYLDMYSENNERKADEIFYNSSLWFKWNCMTCHSEYGAYIKDVLSNEESCPYCSNRQVKPGLNDLKTLHPDIAAMWSDNNEFDADHVFPDVKTWAKWNCPDCGGEYRALVSAIVNGEHTCPYCDGRKATPGVNSLQTLYPDIAKRYSLKNARTADEVFPDVTTPFLWDCPDCGGEYNALMKEVVNGEYTCPYCDGRLILPGFNDFATKHPNLMREYNYAINYIATDSNNISEKSNSPLWWTCPKNPDHNYPMSPARKLWYQKRHREPCPFCKGLRRKKRHFV